MSFENFYVILIITNVLDITTGLIKALYNKNLASGKLREGAVHKAMIWCVVITSYFASSYVGFNLTKVTLGYYIVMELVSIVENAAEFIPIPEELKKYLVVNKPSEKEKVTNTSKEKQVNIITNNDNDDIMNQFK